MLTTSSRETPSAGITSIVSLPAIVPTMALLAMESMSTQMLWA